jgi:MinD-like ATPase involved in chromosome partitioning or flagellar assembly
LVRSIAVVSLGKGTGKTTISLNLALALRKLGYRVLLFDADFTKNNLLEHLDIHNIPVHIGHVLDGDTHINDSVYTHFTGLKIIPSSIHDYDKFSYNFPNLLGDYDYIILDTPMQPEHLSIVLENADEALIVHSPEYSSKNVMDSAEMLSRMKVLNLGIVLNRFSERGADELLGQPIIEKIPPDKDITKSYAMKNPVVYTHPKSKAAKKFHNLAKKLG